MIDKVITVLVFLAYTKADVYTDYPSVPTVEFYSSINNGPGTRRYYPTTPAPIYEDMDDLPPSYPSQRPLFNVINRPFASARSDNVVNIGNSRYSSRVQSQVLFQPAFTPPPLRRTSDPVTYTTHSHSTPLVNLYSGPVISTAYGQPFGSHIPAANQGTTLTYSGTPVSQIYNSHGVRLNY
ncbi:uncharacterized protein LOC112048330 [Bicyclus anynana]|uniref:Uncharacterized protein LOC112048330 n=1 Tax=Bicyclus anynana TaxID=110368 RepID=A0A6J1NEN7_BICAN|nr:uncharacterized protein LOC112048330 [Bicyclus anynana]